MNLADPLWNSSNDNVAQAALTFEAN